MISKNGNFRSAKDIHFDRLKPNGWEKENVWDANSRYAQAARRGLCMHCMREDSNPQHRPRHVIFAFCEDCMIEKSIGMEKIERKAKREVTKWFGDNQEKG